MIMLRTIPFDEPLAARLKMGPGDGVSLYWLGQAGFVIDADGRRIVIDPYLSDSLAVKYRDAAFSHERMVPAPLTPDQLGPVDLVLCTHHHSDHMDGETLSLLAKRLPELNFVVPSASREFAMQRIGLDASRLIEVDAGDRKTIGSLELHVMRAAHETLERDEAGKHRFLGYGMGFGNVRIFHSGDTMPFDGQSEEIKAFAPDLALLPVNGRSEALRTSGFAGNLTLAEAITLSGRCAIAAMIAHHYGMFAFNTIAPDEIDNAAEQAPITLHRARYGIEFRLDGA
ncbi:MBL fold metallo-hydrolase [Rhizobium sophorae]|uniref:MBL fold metallo-hydrolase n=1 Tax=Rhizobium sophorae TaxID=1535242 RepID=A0A7Y3WDJ5_9HYPH|nr:MBL fold metallo-hydrolase [Rhizobium sophorae]MBX4862861.1 MBL fold metallo-hydrolase [Rhizobium bangladeshense]NKL37989.1 MBL fold metallo-hydrolase [Rhizobium leguminosarum bv. viciae]NNU36268.1 MBL fold metallo-hydrolase [Rhizobium sophorae]